MLSMLGDPRRDRKLLQLSGLLASLLKKPLVLGYTNRGLVLSILAICILHATEAGSCLPTYCFEPVLIRFTDLRHAAFTKHKAYCL